MRLANGLRIGYDRMEKGGNSLPHHIKFLTDTTCDLPKETLQALDVTALPMHVC